MNKTTPSVRRITLLEFLGSMNLAITVLVVIAIASVIGTVLQQNKEYTDYIIKFGPFWHEIFKALDLYDVYGSIWFLTLMGFLLLSTSVCIYRNAPVMLRDMRQFRVQVTPKSLRLMHNVREWKLSSERDGLRQNAERFLQREGYRFRVKENDDSVLYSAMKGGMNRLGYIFTHAGIVVICIGGLLDGNLPLSIKEWRGDLKIEKRNNVSAEEIPPISRLAPGDNVSFRGSVNVPEGSKANLVFLNVRDGYLVQELPFVVELKDFRVEHYPSGQPKSFESDLVIHDDQLDKPLEQTIAVNHPLIYRGYAIYQASFSDGGSELSFKLWPLFDPSPKQVEIKSIVGTNNELTTPIGPLTLELTEFKANNVFPATEPEHAGKKFINFGASFNYKLRDADGQAKEYQTYMSPILQSGRYFYLTSMRSSPTEQFRFLHIPADPDMSIKRFMAFHALLNDGKRMKQIAESSTRQALNNRGMHKPELEKNIVTSMVRLLNIFNQGGYVGLDQYIRDTVPEDKQASVAEAYMKILQNLLRSAYVELLRDEGVDLSQDVNETDGQFFDDAVNAIAGIWAYDSPFLLQLDSYVQHDASGLQITRSPGKNIVYLGCVMLIAGIFMMFYIAHKRLWILLRSEDAGTEVIFSGAGNRNARDFAASFNDLGDSLDKFIRRS